MVNVVLVSGSHLSRSTMRKLASALARITILVLIAGLVFWRAPLWAAERLTELRLCSRESTAARAWMVTKFITQRAAQVRRLSSFMVLAHSDSRTGGN